jgi:SAM-dependent methyltransferase
MPATVESSLLSAPAVSPESFETVYAHADGDPARIPWADQRPHPALVTWLDFVAPSLVRCGSRVVVVGCGLGDDARELIRRGYDVTAFDVSATAVRWAKELDPEHAGCYHRADLFDLPTRWQHRFDLVIEINTVQSLPPSQHASSLMAVSRLAAMRGWVLMICRHGSEVSGLDDGPPWPLTKEQLCSYAAVAGFEPDGSIDVFEDDETPPVTRMRALLRRA